MTLAVNTEQSQDQSAVMLSLIQRAATDSGVRPREARQALGRTGTLGERGIAQGIRRGAGRVQAQPASCW